LQGRILQPLYFDRSGDLPVSAAAVTTTTAVESTTATTMEAAAAYVTAVAAAITVTRSSIATAVAAAVAVAAAIAAVYAAVSIAVTAIPGAGTDKEAAVEPRRSVVSVGRASIGIITVVAIGAGRSRVAIAITPVYRPTDPDSNRHLSMGIGRSGK
jgi:hypothetical protein